MADEPLGEVPHREAGSALVGTGPQIRGRLPSDIPEGDQGQGQAEVPCDVGRPDHDQDSREQAATDRDQPSRVGGHHHLHAQSHFEQTIRASPVIPAVSRLSDVQFSRFTETEVAKLLTFGRPRGVLEVMVPMTDDERRDLETHIKEHFRLSLAVQVKAARVLYPHGRVSRLQKRFFVKRERLIEDLFFWYFFGFMDLATAAFRPPVFLVPSHVVHAEAVHQVHGNIVEFNFVASMSPLSRDRWRPYACDPAELAGRVVKFLRAQERRKLTAISSVAGSMIAEPGTILVVRA